MPVEVAWDNEDHTIICYNFTPFWTTDDLEAAMKEAHDLMTSVSHTVHTIADLRGLKPPPHDILKMLQPIEANAPDNKGMNVIVGAGFVTMAFHSVARHVAPGFASRQRFAGTLEHARSLIYRNEK